MPKSRISWTATRYDRDPNTALAQATTMVEYVEALFRAGCVTQRWQQDALNSWSLHAMRVVQSCRALGATLN